jgi:hypothetical protein
MPDQFSAFFASSVHSRFRLLLRLLLPVYGFPLDTASFPRAVSGTAL